MDPVLDFPLLKRNALTSILQAVDVGTDLECGAQLDVHGRHEMLLFQEQQGLSVNFLRQELGGQVLAACAAERGQWMDEKVRGASIFTSRKSTNLAGRR